MQFITAIAALFATAALATPQFGFGNGFGGRNGRGGNQEGAYFTSCTCTRDGYEDPYLGRAACDELSYRYPNLGWDGSECVDYDGQGVEYNGFSRACQSVGFGNFVDAQCFR